MKLQNETEYRTREMKKILTAVHRFLARHEGRLPQWSRVIFEIRYTRHRISSGHAYLHGTYSLLRFRRPAGRAWKRGRDGMAPEDAARVRDVARLGYHEILHLYGYHHDQMATYFPTDEEVEVICQDAGFRPEDFLPRYGEEAESEPDLDPQEEKIQEAEAILRKCLRKRKEWTTKARRAKTALDTWRRKEMAARRKLRDLGVESTEEIIEDELGDYEPAMAGDLKV